MSALLAQGANLGITAFWLLLGWLVCAAVAGAVAQRKGYPEHWGLASGLLLAPIGVVGWLVWPAKPSSAWKRDGPFPKRPRPPQR